MFSLPMRWLAPGTHLLNALLLAGTLAAADRALTPPRRAAAHTGLPAVTPAPEPTARPPVSTAAIVERGLFGRAEAEVRAAPRTAPAASTPLPPRSQVSGPPPALVGTALYARGGAAAFVSPGGRQELVAPGEAIDDQWRLVAVRRGSAVVEHRSGRRDTVSLHDQVAGPPLPALD